MGGNIHSTNRMRFFTLEEQLKKTIDIVRKGRDPNVVFYNKKTPLHMCAKVVMSHKLTNYFSFKQVLDNDGLTAMKIACSKGHAEVIDILVNYGTFPTADDDLYYACTSGSAKAVNRVLRFIHNPNILTNNQDSTLNYACLKGYVEVVKSLLNHTQTNVNQLVAVGSDCA